MPLRTEGCHLRSHCAVSGNVAVFVERFWQCGQVQTADVSGNSIDAKDWTLAAKGETVDSRSAPNSEPRSVQTGEANELRFLREPSYSSLRRSS
jgi:hypothetical protein